MRESPPEKELRERRKRFTALLAEKRLPAMLISEPADVRWLSGFTGDDSVLFFAHGRKYILTDFRYIEEAQQSAPGWTVMTQPPGFPAMIGQLVKKLRLKKVAMDSNHLRLHSFELLRKAARGVKWLPAPMPLRSLRMRKSAWEVAQIEKALRIQEKAFLTVCSTLHSGCTERLVASELRSELVKNGAADQAFPIMVQFGPNSSLPHGRPTLRRLRLPSVVLIDWGARCVGYHSDLTRTFFLGSIPDRLRRIHELVLEAQAAAVEAVRPGVAFAEVDRSARDIIAKAGFGECFGHSTGHGVGLQIHEGPTLHSRVKGTLEPGMVITVEPGIYLPGIGGVRIEDDVLVTKTGGRVLSRLSRGLRWNGNDAPRFRTAQR